MNKRLTLKTGAGNFSVAIVDLPNGEIILPFADDIQFLDGTGVIDR